MTQFHLWCTYVLLLLALDERLVRLDLGAQTGLDLPGGGNFTHLLHQSVLDVEQASLELAHRVVAQRLLRLHLLLQLLVALETRRNLPAIDVTRSSAIAEGPRDASCQLKSRQLPRNSAETTYMTSADQIDAMKLEI